MNPNQRRATVFTSDQINYIKGCSKLQEAVWIFCNRDPFMALSDKISLRVLRQAIIDLMNAREKLRKQVLKSIVQKWLKNAQLMSVSNLRRNQLLKSRINRFDAYKRFILSQAVKNWRINTARSVENFLSRIGAFMKLMEAGAKRKTKAIGGSFQKNLKGINAPKYLRKPLKGCVNLYKKSQKSIKSRALNIWRIKVRDMNNQLMKRQLSLKNIVKPIIFNDNTVKRSIFNKWRHNTLGLRSKLEKMMLLRGHLKFSLYNKFPKTNLLNNLSNTFNEWRRKAQKKPINYLAKIFQAKSHMLKHNIT